MLASVGAVVSTTVTVKVALASLPDVSVAEQVTVVVPSANVEPAAGEHMTGRGPSTRSVAVGSVNVTGAPDGPVASTLPMFAGMPASTGGVVSCTLTVKDADDEWPVVSLAWQVTRVSPRVKLRPDAGEQVTGRMPSTASVATGNTYVTVAALGFGPVASAVLFVTAVKTGPTLSATVTVNDPVVWLPRPSLASQTTEVKPSGNTAPDTTAGPPVPSVQLD